MKRGLSFLVFFMLIWALGYPNTEPGFIMPSSITTFASSKVISTTESDNKKLLIWEDSPLTEQNSPHFYAQMLNMQGDLLWKSPTSLSSSDKPTNSHKIVWDDAGGVIITWEEKDPNTEFTDVVAQRIDSSGNKLWGPDGRRLSKAISNKITPFLVSDGASGAIFVWSDSRNDLTCQNWDIYAQRIDSLGNYLWDEEGILISADQKDEFIGKILRSGTGDVTVVWNKIAMQSVSNGGDIDFCYQKIDLKGQFVAEAKFLSLPANSGNYTIAGEIIGDEDQGFFMGLINRESRNLLVQHVNHSQIRILNKQIFRTDTLDSNYYMPDIKLVSLNNELMISWQASSSSLHSDTLQTIHNSEYSILPDSIVSYSSSRTEPDKLDSISENPIIENIFVLNDPQLDRSGNKSLKTDTNAWKEPKEVNYTQQRLRKSEKNTVKLSISTQNTETELSVNSTTTPEERQFTRNKPSGISEICLDKSVQNPPDIIAMAIYRDVNKGRTSITYVNHVDTAQVSASRHVYLNRSVVQLYSAFVQSRPNNLVHIIIPVFS